MPPWRTTVVSIPITSTALGREPIRIGVRSGHWELLEPGHGEVWRWWLTPGSKQAGSIYAAPCKRRRVFSSHRKVARAFLVRHETDSPTCGFAEAVDARPSSRKKIFYRRQRRKQSRKDHGPLTADHRPAAVACAKAADEKD